MEELRGARVLVLGLGLSGRSAAEFCARRGADVVAADERPRAALEDLSALEGCVELRLGGPLPEAAGFDLVVPSPGVPPGRYTPGARRVWGDVELAGRALGIPVVAITGTNGKSTVTRLVEALLCAAGLRARAAGNLGIPALDLVGQPLDVAVLEVSSFQLETTECFRPHVAVLLNVAPDHLDRHGSFEAYVEAKARILLHQTRNDVAVLNLGDAAVAALQPRVRGVLLPFRQSGPLEEGLWLDGGACVIRHGGATVRLALEGVTPRGGAWLENLLAALAVVTALGADVEKAVRCLPGFQGLPHRMEPVATRDGVHFVDDSKATNPAAAVRALEGTDAPIVWIAGGRDKGFDFRDLARVAARRARAAVLLGEAAPTLQRILAGLLPVHRARDLEDAVRQAAALARPGDVVLLSPACSSLDQFRNFEERGQRFRTHVEALATPGRRT